MATKWRSTTLTIASGQTASGEIDLTESGARRVITLTIIAPGTLPEVVTAQVADKVGGTYGVLQRPGGGADVAVLAGKATPTDPFTAGAFKLVAGGAVASDRVFLIQGATFGQFVK